MSEQRNKSNLQLHYTMMCEDVRLEVNHKLSLMGIFYGLQVPQLPVTLLKIVVLNHWSGEGQFLSEVRIVSPDRVQPIAVSPPSPFEIPANGFADNVTIFANITFPAQGNYYVQTLINSNLFAEQILSVTQLTEQQTYMSSEAIQ
jgi:hypothetical protein